MAATTWRVHGTSFRAETPHTLQVVVVGPYARSIVALAHRWGQQRVHHVVMAGMCCTAAHDVGMGGITSVRWLRWPGRAALVAQRTQGLWRCPPQHP